MWSLNYCRFLFLASGLFSQAEQAAACDSTIPPLSLAGNFSSALELPPTNTSSSDSGGIVVRCSGSHFGFNPNIADCESAKGYIVLDSEQLTFGERYAGLGDVTPLPYRIMGCM